MTGPGEPIPDHASTDSACLDRRHVVLGRIAGAHGVRGELRVKPFTGSVDALLEFGHWLVGGEGRWQERKLVSGRTHGAVLLVRLDGVTDRDAALDLRGSDVAVRRDALPHLADDEYYWSDLAGLTVTAADGTRLGTVERLFATGANDVMVVHGDRERLIPFVLDQVVKRVDLKAGTVEVDWDPDF